MDARSEARGNGSCDGALFDGLDGSTLHSGAGRSLSPEYTTTIGVAGFKSCRGCAFQSAGGGRKLERRARSSDCGRSDEGAPGSDERREESGS